MARDMATVSAMGLLAQIAEAKATPSRHKERIFVGPQEWLHLHRREELAKLSMTGRVFVGEQICWTAGRKSKRWLLEGTKTVVGGVEYPIGEMELRSPYLSACQGGTFSRWSNADADAANSPGWAQVYYRAPEVPEDGLLTVDISKTYLQIFKHFSTQVEYNRSKGIWAPAGNPWQDIEELERHQAVYSSIVTHSWRSRRGGLYYRGELVEIKHNSPFYQPQAAALLCDILHAIAHEMVGLFGAYQIFTDGYTVDAAKAEDVKGYLLERWGLSSKIKPNPGRELVNAQDNIYDQGDQKRQQLAWLLSGTGPEDGPLTIYIADGRRRYHRRPFTPAVPTCYHSRNKKDPNKALKCPLRPKRTQFERALERRAKSPRSMPYAPAVHWHHEPTTVYHGDVVSPPDLGGLIVELAEKLRAPP